jgi:hypothetical protein
VKDIDKVNLLLDHILEKQIFPISKWFSCKCFVVFGHKIVLNAVALKEIRLLCNEAPVSYLEYGSTTYYKSLSVFNLDCKDRGKVETGGITDIGQFASEKFFAYNDRDKLNLILDYILDNMPSNSIYLLRCTYFEMLNCRIVVEMRGSDGCAIHIKNRLFATAKFGSMEYYKMMSIINFDCDGNIRIKNGLTLDNVVKDIVIGKLAGV